MYHHYKDMFFTSRTGSPVITGSVPLFYWCSIGFQEVSRVTVCNRLAGEASYHFLFDHHLDSKEPETRYY